MSGTGLISSSRRLLDEMASASRVPQSLVERVRFRGDDQLVSCFAVTALAGAAVATASSAVASLIALDAPDPPIEVDVRLASLWFGWSLRPMGWQVPSPWDAIAGDYRTDGGWIKLHTNAKHHRAAALSVLGCEPTREAVARAVSVRGDEDLEAEVVNAGGCAARLRTLAEWATHPQGQAVAAEPLVIWDAGHATEIPRWKPRPQRPLAGLRVLDLTRVIAGPVATRFLAGFGADVLRIDPPGWDEPGVIPDVSIGKRCARLDLTNAENRDVFTELIACADALVHGYRSDALDRLGFGYEARQAIRPGLIDVSLDAYGHSGPWARRRGFDSLVQFSTGIADEGMRWRNSDAPVSLPVQALDHATGYLVAAATLSALRAGVVDGFAERARVSLARVAKILVDHQGEPNKVAPRPNNDDDYTDETEPTAWGHAQRLRSPVNIEGIPLAWTIPAGLLGVSAPTWSSTDTP